MSIDVLSYVAYVKGPTRHLKKVVQTSKPITFDTLVTVKNLGIYINSSIFVRSKYVITPPK